MRFKKVRLSSELIRASKDPAFFDQIHVIFGGSGAVGGATAVQLISLFEEALVLHGKPPTRFPQIIITARTKQEIRQFTSTLFRLQERDYQAKPSLLPGVGYRTVKGVVVELHSFQVNPNLPEFDGFAVSSHTKRTELAQGFLELGGLKLNSPMNEKTDLIRRIIQDRLGEPFMEFLNHRKESLQSTRTFDRFKSVVVCIPLASMASYKLSDLEALCCHLGIDSESPLVQSLKVDYLRALTNDLTRAAVESTENVLVAHTTAVGGMYDEGFDGERTLRLGFAHSALDERLVQKQIFAEELARLYAERGIKMLVTAAAIGIDSILENKSLPLNAAIRVQLQESQANSLPILPETDIKAGVARVYPPVSFDLHRPEHESVCFEHGHPLILDYVLKSGENGFFTPSNAEALYRVMRVTSSQELGLLLARTAAFGDDPQWPFFVDNICYYTESDYSRQVFDLLGQPQIRKNQLSGLQPKALQDLGSAKHQAELHMMGLLILLHRLRTLNLEAIPRHVDLRTFNSKEFFETHSQALTLDHVLGWNAASISDALTTLVTASKEDDLLPLKHFYQADPTVQEAINRVFRNVTSAIRAVTSLGTPILYEAQSQCRVLSGYYAAPIGQIVTHRDSLHQALKQSFERLGWSGTATFDEFIDFYAASFGFLDTRPIAVLATGSGDRKSSDVQVFNDESAFIDALRRLKPYTPFATGGVLALIVRLKNLHRLSRQLDFRLGSENEFRAHFWFDESGRTLLVPGLIEAFRMVSEGLEKNTGLERIDGRWGYYLEAG